MNIPPKVAAHVTEISFGAVCAVWTAPENWEVHDQRLPVGRHVVAKGLTIETATLKAYAVSTCPPGPRACNALAPVCGNRCTEPAGHPGDQHRHQGVSGRGSASWMGDHSDDPAALESEARSSSQRRGADR